MMDYAPLIERWRDTELDAWAQMMPEQLERGLCKARYGDLPRWLAALESLPELLTSDIKLSSGRVSALGASALDAVKTEALYSTLQALHPWRKGPFELFGVHIDTEWRSDWKWDRLIDGIESLQDRRVLDVGCGSGYHCWRMLGAGAREVIGIDPTPLFVVQFWAIQRYLQQADIWVLPAGIEHVPPKLAAFDTVFSMGVLYHRRSPMDHLLELRHCLRPEGQLVLETLVIEGGDGEVLVPEGRYARMGNVWFLPTTATLMGWLRKLGYADMHLLDVSVTSTDEQRATDWMRFHSLADFLDPMDSSKTIEGYPAPRRAIVTARAPAK
ncbi:MAG: tRNA 5-methoxyuridine(34)/uridine 5-oxyacetic acid(34) synthase CmoB [Pseudomonadota bacterium]